MPTITCKVSEKLAAQLAELARRQRRSKSSLFREALEKRLDLGGRNSPSKAIDLVRHLKGCLKGGPSDLATNPKYMKDFGK